MEYIESFEEQYEEKEGFSNKAQDETRMLYYYLNGDAARRHTAPRALVYMTYYINYINKSTRKLRVKHGVIYAGPFLT